MAKKTSKPESPFVGRWRIVSMSQWEDEYLDEEVEAYIEFNERQGGSFQFGYIQSVMDYREGQPAAEFSWEGGDGADGTPLIGRGWAVLKGEGLHGIISIHMGDESEFEAVRAAGTGRPKRK
jgi:hypothetical protein